MTIVKITDPNTGIVYSYFMEKRLVKNLKERVIPLLREKDHDYVMIVDGREGSGKSTLSFQIARFVDPSFNIDKICINTDEFRKAILRAKKGECVCFDEAYRGFGSSSALSEVNKVLKSMMMEMRQKNLLVIIVMPTFYLFEKYLALWRAESLIHITKRGIYHVFNNKKKQRLYLNPIGKRYYSYNHVKTRFRGKFYGKYAIDEQEYRDKKAKSFQEGFKQTRDEKYQEQRDKLVNVLHSELKLSLSALSELLKKHNISLSKPVIGKLISKLK